jgi:hypothetical protein
MKCIQRTLLRTTYVPEKHNVCLVYSAIDLRPTGAQLWLNAWKEESADLPTKEKKYKIDLES